MAWKVGMASTPTSTAASSRVSSIASTPGIGLPARQATLTRHCAGFTLIELAVVIFIMALLATLVTPYVGSLRDARLKSEARRLAGRAAYLFAAAAAQNLVLQLNFDLRANGYFVTFFDPYSLSFEPAPYLRPGGEPVRLPQSVRIRDVVVAKPASERQTVVTCNFYPQGFADATVVHLVSSYGQVMTVAVSPLNGRVRIMRGDIPATAVFYAAATD